VYEFLELNISDFFGNSSTEDSQTILTSTINKLENS
jgi:hypothetical protein